MPSKRVPRKGGGVNALARVGDPLVTAEGKTIDPDGYAKGRPLPKEAPALVLDAANFRPIKKRSLKEMPGEVGMINAVAAVFMYTMLGIGDREIGDALGLSGNQVDDVRRHPAYKECFDMVVAEFINKNSDLLAARIAAYSHSALDVVGQISANGKKEETRLKASTDLLDRAGVRAKDIADKGSTNKSELRIIVVDNSKDKNINLSVDMEGLDDDLSA